MSILKITLRIAGMHCASCANEIESALKKSEGLVSVNVNFATEKATIEYDSKKITEEEIAKKIEGAGYQVIAPELTLKKERKVSLKIGEMHCASCAQKIEKALKKSIGVLNANVNFATEKATVNYDETKISVKQLKQVVIDTGYTVLEESILKTDEQHSREEKILIKARNRLIWSWSFTIPIMLWMLPEMIFKIAWPTHFIYNVGLIVLATPVVFIMGWPTIQSSFKSALRFSVNMDVLIVMGTFVSFFAGISSLFTPIANYGGIAAMIMAFHLTGKYIETKAKGRASSAIKKLLELGAKTARVLIDNQEKEISIEEVQLNQIMIVKPGEKIPTDGVIIKGESSIDESMATGESIPVVRKAGNNVIGATINQLGLLHIKATKIGKDTFLSQVIKMVEECQGTKVPIQAFADKVTSYFVPAVIVIAVLTFISWLIFPLALKQILFWAGHFIPWVNPNLSTISLAIFAAVAVLVIACPCALGLATPTALMVGSGIGAENGILIRDGSAIQTLKDIHTIVFDKTGTLTKGEPEITDVMTFENKGENYVIQLAASIESGSEHPLAQAIINYVRTKNIALLSPENFESVTGKGVKAVINGKDIKIGNQKLFDSNALSSDVKRSLDQLQNDAKTTILIAENDRIIGIIGVADTLKNDSVKAIAELENMGLKTVMLTGDNERTANVIAKQVGISRIIANVLPDQKVNVIKKLQAEVGMVAMVGDGINDAPALKQANVGIAIGTGTDIAIEASNVTLVSGDLSSVVNAIKLSRATFRKIKQNLYWAYGYNTLAIPIAILGLLHPVIAEIAMAGSSITVVTNANLLRRLRLK